MSEANSTPVQEKPKKKKRHLWCLNLLLAVAVFAGGVILGLKLPGMPLPYELVERYFPQLTAQSETVAAAAVEPVKANPAELPAAPQPTEAPAPTQAPEPVATPAPTQAPEPEETPAPEETAKPEEPEEAKPEAEQEIPAEPAEEPEPETAAAVDSVDEPAAIPEDQAEQEQTEPAADEAKPAFIGLDAALDAALRHVKLRGNEVEVYGVYKSTNAETVVYVVEFSAKDADYMYMINAENGEVEGWQKSRPYWDVEDYGTSLPDTFGFTFNTEDGGHDNPAL